MPNGGSDNCGTCWFNLRNNGRYARAPAERDDARQAPDVCLVRGHAIDTDPFHTYCANHPQHNGEDGLVLRAMNREGHVYFDLGPTVPIGPIWIMRSHAEGRVVLAASPDTACVRAHLLAIAGEIHPHNWPGPGLEHHPHRWHVAMWQLGELRESRAVPALRAVLQVEIADREEQLAHPLLHLRARRWTELQATARDALAKIESPEG